jgi:hypothetical protein
MDSKIKIRLNRMNYVIGNQEVRIRKTRKVKVKSTLEQAMKAQRGRRGIALLFL